MTATDASLMQQFIPEARELLEQAGANLLALERDSGTETMNALFRAVHTLKGTSGLFDIAPFTRVVHAAEDLLSAVQAGRFALTSAMADTLLTGFDQVGSWIDALGVNGALPADAEAAAGDWVRQLRAPLAATMPGLVTLAAQASDALPEWAAQLAAPLRAGPHGDSDHALIALRYRPDPQCFFRGEDPLALLRQLEGLQLLRAAPREPWPGLAELDPFLCNIDFTAIVAAPRAEVEHLFRYALDEVDIAALPPGWPETAEARDAAAAASDDSALRAETIATLIAAQRRMLTAAGEPGGTRGRLSAAIRALRGVLRRTGERQQLDAAAAAALAAPDPAPLLAFLDSVAPPAGLSAAAATPAVRPGNAPAAAAASLRVAPERIDQIMNLVGQLVVAKNALAHLARQAEHGALGAREMAREVKDSHALVSRIAEEMQSAVMAVRMLPFEHVFQRFPRLVRDIARRLGKEVALQVEGGATEADKNVVEALADPLIHIVRNSLDHGIETPECRRAAGKPAEGTIRLSAAQENDHIIIRISDDGAGIDAEAVRRKAVEKGLLDAERAAALSEQEAIMLVFAPGFSTAAEISDLSGRGVGMDVVRSTVEKAGGRVALSSRKGLGTEVALTLPLSMVVTRIMTVLCGDRMYGVPMAAVVETVRVPRAALHRFRDREAIVLRDSVVPVLRLARLLDLPEAPAAVEEEAILVVRLNGERLGIVVSAFREGMEVIVKPMEGMLAEIGGLAGTTLLGDGRVLLILDLRELVH